MESGITCEEGAGRWELDTGMNEEEGIPPIESLSHSVEDPHVAAQVYSEEGGRTLCQKAREGPKAKKNWSSILRAVRITKGVS